MKNLLLLVTLLASISLYGQNRLSLETFGALGVGKSPNSFLDEFADQELALLSRYGVGGIIPVTGNFFFRTGFQMSEYGSKFFLGLTTNDNNGMILSTGEVEIQSRNRQAELLFLARYELPTYKRIVPYFEAGLISTLYIHTKDNFTPDLPISSFDPTIGEDPYQLSGTKRFNTVARIGTGVSFHLFRNTALCAGLVGQRYISSAAEEGLATIYPWRIDVETGVRFFLGK